jgi:hypothetical protein
MSVSILGDEIIASLTRIPHHCGQAHVWVSVFTSLVRSRLGVHVALLMDAYNIMSAYPQVQLILSTGRCLPDMVEGLTAATRREMDKGIGVFTWTNVMNLALSGGMFVTLIRRG